MSLEAFLFFKINGKLFGNIIILYYFYTMKEQKVKKAKLDINGRRVFAFKAEQDLIDKANKKYYLRNGRISLSSLVEQLLIEYTSK